MDSLFVSCAPYLEPLLKEELEELDITSVQLSKLGVYIPYSVENIYTVNYLSRIATRLFLPLLSFPCPSKEDLYRECKRIPWLDFLDETKTFCIDAHIQHPEIRNSLYGAQLVKDAVCDCIREKKGARPSIDTKNPDVQLHLTIYNKRALVSFNTSGAPLYKRGYREHVGSANLPETLAAAILRKARYSKKDVLCDPFCGSGTFLMEAACIATQTPAGYFREKWGFMHLPLFQEEEWKEFKKSWDAKRDLSCSYELLGADKDPQAIDYCNQNFKKLGLKKEPLLISTPIHKLKLSEAPTLIVTNPPFGKRMTISPSLYAELGEFLHTQCSRAPFAYVLSSSPSLIQATKYPILSEMPLQHGGLKLSLYQLSNQ